jgi:dihydrofolate synthase/folylpolyglutamate synthase
MKPGLEETRDLLQALGNPQERFLSVHVAGTNGKGSVCALVEQGVRALGLRSGLFTSPHLVRVHERIRFGGEDISDDLLQHCLDRIEAVEGDLSRLPTFFETLTVAAFLAFAEKGVQVAVIETGLGGRLDCTNVLQPLVSVITRVDMDHEGILGSTLEKIAFEKAGIIKPGRPVVVGAQALPAETVLRRRAEEVEAPLRLAALEITVSGQKPSLQGQQFHLATTEADYGTVKVPLLGRFQTENVATALCAMEALTAELGIPLPPAKLKAAWAEVVWPARGEVLSEQPPVLLDVAHNPGGAKALKGLLMELFGRSARGTFVFASLRDKDTREVVRILSPLMHRVYCVTVTSDRAHRAEDLAEWVRDCGTPAEAVSLAEARQRVADGGDAGDFTCITGSVYLAGEWRASGPLHPGDPAGDPSEG